jgi:hypothetical protein
MGYHFLPKVSNKKIVSKPNEIQLARSVLKKNIKKAESIWYPATNVQHKETSNEKPKKISVFQDSALVVLAPSETSQTPNERKKQLTYIELIAVFKRDLAEQE